MGYEGVGAGFCETFLKAWRTLLPSENISLIKYEEAIEKEKQKYLSLLLKLPQEYQSAIHNGFISDIQKKYPDSYLESILLKSVNQTDNHGNYLFFERKEH